MAALRRVTNPLVYQLMVTLLESEPPIWRRIQVPADITLAKLHQVLQVVMGWEESHLHQFIVGNTYYGEPDPYGGVETKSERRAKLNQVAPNVGDRFIYEYDFGDSWEHGIEVEQILPAEPGAHYPICVAGERAGPPEDCGGVWGYAELLEAIQDPDHPEHEERRDWVPEDFDPEGFDRDAVNQTLKQIR